MRWTLKELLKQCRLALKKNTSKRDKWVKEWAGQVTACYISQFFSISLIGIVVSVSKNVLNAMFFRSCKVKVTSVSSKWLIQPWRLSVSVA